MYRGVRWGYSLNMDEAKQSPIAIGIKEAARLLSVSPGTIRNQLRTGGLPAVHIGRSVRIPTEAVEKFIDAGGSPRPITPIIESEQE